MKSKLDRATIKPDLTIEKHQTTKIKNLRYIIELYDAITHIRIFVLAASTSPLLATIRNTFRSTRTVTTKDLVLYCRQTNCLAIGTGSHNLLILNTGVYDW